MILTDLDFLPASIWLLRYQIARDGEWLTLGLVKSLNEAKAVALKSPALAWEATEYVRGGRPRVVRLDPIVIGRTYGRLTVTEKIGRIWACSCVCGGTVRARSSDLLNGRTRSCGCSRLRPNCRCGKPKTGGYCAECRKAYDLRASERRKKKDL